MPLGSRYVVAGLALAFDLANASAADTIKIGYINGLSEVFGLTCEKQLKAFYAAADMQVSVLTDCMARQPVMRKVYLVNPDYAYSREERGKVDARGQAPRYPDRR